MGSTDQCSFDLSAMLTVSVATDLLQRRGLAHVLWPCPLRYDQIQKDTGRGLSRKSSSQKLIHSLPRPQQYVKQSHFGIYLEDLGRARHGQPRSEGVLSTIGAITSATSFASSFGAPNNILQDIASTVGASIMSNNKQY